MSAYVFAGSALILYLAIALVLIQKYRRTRDAGFVWLGIAVIVWPLAANVITWGERVAIDRLARHQSVGFYPFTLVERGAATLGSLVFGLAAGQQIVGLVLLLIAVGIFGRGTTMVR